MHLSPLGHPSQEGGLPLGAGCLRPTVMCIPRAGYAETSRPTSSTLLASLREGIPSLREHPGLLLSLQAWFSPSSGLQEGLNLALYLGWASGAPRPSTPSGLSPLGICSQVRPSQSLLLGQGEAARARSEIWETLAPKPHSHGNVPWHLLMCDSGSLLLLCFSPCCALWQ